MSHEPIDADDLDRLVREHLVAAVRFATRLTGCPDAAEEVVQEALLRVARHFRRFRGKSSFRTWFFQIVVNVFRDRPVSRTESHEVVEVSAIDGDSATAMLMAEETSALIAREVSRLPPRQREVIVLTVYEGVSISETAELLAITEQNVHASLHLARRRLREQLADHLLEKS
ncbi:MAG: RNA polymerase sigma factor [Planctomycetaceae bacterium]|nr:RNA polymerase sigma factor [Planctomycetaceae bacterium]